MFGKLNYNFDGHEYTIPYVSLDVKRRVEFIPPSLLVMFTGSNLHFYDWVECRCIKQIKIPSVHLNVFDSFLNFLVLNPRTVLLVGDLSVVSYSIPDGIVQKVFCSKLTDFFLNLFFVSDNIYGVLGYGGMKGSIFLVSHSENKVIKNLDEQCIGDNSIALLSKTIRNSFYVSSTLYDSYRVRLVHFEKKFDTIDLENHNDEVSDMKIIQTSYESEILGVAAKYAIFLYSPKPTPTLLRKFKYDEIGLEAIPVELCVFNDRYLIAYEKNVRIYAIAKDGKDSKILCRQKIIKDGDVKFRSLVVLESMDEKVKFCGINGRTLTFFDFQPLDTKKVSFEDYSKDEIERIDYLKYSNEEYDENGTVETVTLKLGFLSIRNLFKIFFL